MATNYLNQLTINDIDYDIYAKNIVTYLKDMTSDATHRTVSDTQINSWDAKATASQLKAVAWSGLYSDLINPPSIPTKSTVSGWGFVEGAYKIPSGQDGIPRYDLSTDVKASLALADSALQSHQSLANYYNKSEIAEILANYPLTESLASVATSGSYVDLSNKPVIPTKATVTGWGFYEFPASKIPMTDLSTDVSTTINSKQKNIYQQSSEPSNPVTDDLWIDTDEGGEVSTVTWGSIIGSISDQTDLNTILTNKQNKLTAGTNITIDENNVISATGGSGGTYDFNQLTNRPSYNGSVITGSTSIPEVKTEIWDAKYDKPANGIPDSDIVSASTWNGKQKNIYQQSSEPSDPVSGDLWINPDAIPIINTNNRIIKTVMDSVATINADYFLGTQTSVSFTLPTCEIQGKYITVVFYSGETAATLLIGGNIIGDVPTPSTNQRIELNILWDGTYWAIVSNVMEVTQ